MLCSNYRRFDLISFNVDWISYIAVQLRTVI